jgi:hypothetical protein
MAKLITSMVCRSLGVDILSLFSFCLAGYVCSYCTRTRFQCLPKRLVNMEQSGDTIARMDTIFAD